jgi:hypothetical protein
MLYFTLVRSKFEYASVVRNSVTTTDANKLERIQQKFSAFCCNRFLPHVHYSYAKALEQGFLICGVRLPRGGVTCLPEILKFRILKIIIMNKKLLTLIVH